MRRLWAGLAVALPVAACLGEIAPPAQPSGGWADENGLFHTADGKVPFPPGAGCDGFDVHGFYASPPAFCGGDGDCAAWGRGRAPAGLFPVAPCRTTETPPLRNTCGSSLGMYWGKAAVCEPGPIGDAYCTSYFSHFVLGAGIAPAACSGPVCAERQLPNMGGECVRWLTTGICEVAGCSDPVMLEVARVAQSHCEPPCAPPP